VFDGARDLEKDARRLFDGEPHVAAEAVGERLAGEQGHHHHEDQAEEDLPDWPGDIGRNPFDPRGIANRRIGDETQHQPDEEPAERWLLRVFAPGTGSRPSFGDPAEVARWWVRTVARGKLVALKAWPRPGFDRRDLRLHRLFVVAYSPFYQPGIDERSGMFVTAVRDGYGGRWRFLEATVVP